MKLPLSFFISMSVVFGFILQGTGAIPSLLLSGAGVFFLACGSAALNHFQDREYDRHLERTRNRPLPSGRLPARRAIIISAVMIPSGSALLYLSATSILPFVLGITAVLLYNGVYTPFKHKSGVSLSAGAACGMVPPLIGWTAAGGSVFSIKIAMIMAIFGLWQLPHFWLVLLANRADYRRSGVQCMIQGLSGRRLEKISFIWILNFAAMLPAVPAVYMNSVRISGWLIVACAAGLIMSAFKHMIWHSGSGNYRRAFLHLNGALFFVMLVVISDSIIWG
jgi:protoheme IX farnesyltransferase